MADHTHEAHDLYGLDERFVSIERWRTMENMLANLGRDLEELEERATDVISALTCNLEHIHAIHFGEHTHGPRD